MDERNVHPDPIVQFRAWLDEAVAEGVREPDAMTIATAGLEATGTVARLSREESLAYWRNRPLGSRLSALVSPQSEVVADRAELEAAYEAAAARYGDDPPLPDSWGGFVVAPDEVELWEGRPNRLHDRLRYSRVDDGWVRERLAP